MYQVWAASISQCNIASDI